jgi:hypothetical protein
VFWVGPLRHQRPQSSSASRFTAAALSPL